MHQGDIYVTSMPISGLKPYANNPRTHTDAQIKKIVQSIEAFGWTNPILVDAEGTIVAGHGRYEAAKRLGLQIVPTIRLSDMSEEQVRAYVLADNRLAELAGWNDELLAIELKGLSEVKLDFDLEATGFETPEIDRIILDVDGLSEEDPADRVPPRRDEEPPVSQSGDIWRLGPHRLLCGDATEPEAYKALLRDERADMVFTDPPYNVPVDGHICGLGTVQHREFAMASGEMSSAEFVAFLERVMRNMAFFSTDGSVHFVCMDWRHIFELLSAGRAVYDELKNLCVWNKTNGGMGSLYRSKHELIGVFKSGQGPHVNNVKLGSHGRYRTNVWDYRGINAFGRARESELAMHPTVKPIALIRDAILDCSRRGDMILDPFAGSGTTILAAERVGRRCYAMELDPHYVDVALTRYLEAIGQDPIHEQSGLSFSFLK